MEIISKNTPNKTRRITQEQVFIQHGRKAPQALDLEEAVLGALMLEQDALTNVIDVIKPDFFYHEKHRKIFEAIYALFSNSEPVDILTVTEELRKRGQLEDVGGAYFISDLTTRIASAANVEYHARIVAQKFIQRELIRIGTEITHDAFEETTDVLDLLDRSERKLLDIGEQNFRTDYTDMHALIREAKKEIEDARKHESGLSGVPSGFPELDRVTNGWQKGTLLILAARPAMGKTAFALTMARNIAVDFKKPVAFFSLEMSAIELVTRLISSETMLSSQKLKKGDLRLDEWQQLNTLVEGLSNAPLYIDDTPALTMFELRAKCRRLKQKHNIEMVFVDYLQLMQGSSDQRGNREQEISSISRQLKALSKELKIPVLALSQLSRSVETRGGSKKPQLSDLRESGAIEQDADIVMFIYRPEYYKIDSDEKGPTAGMADILLEKHRSGPTGDVRLRFKSQYAKFESAETNMDDVSTVTDYNLQPSNDFDNKPFVRIPSKLNDDLNNDAFAMPNDDTVPF